MLDTSCVFVKMKLEVALCFSNGALPLLCTHWLRYLLPIGNMIWQKETLDSLMLTKKESLQC